MTKIRMIIAGGRDFQDYERLEQNFDSWMEGVDNDNITIISGGARGADRLGERIAEEYNLDLKIYPANWETYGKKAGYIRNQQMANNATHLLAAWDRQSRGTMHMINIAQNMGLQTLVINYEPY